MIRPAVVICAFLVAVVLARQHPAAASELLANGDFEEGIAGWSTNAGLLDPVSGPLHGGSQAARFSGSGQPTIQFAYQLIDVLPASNYELSGWVAAAPSGLSRAFLRVSWFDANGSVVLSADSPWLGPPDGGFKLLATGAMVSPSAARRARASLLIQADSPFTVHLDDFTFSGPSFVPPPPTTPEPGLTPPSQVTPAPTPPPPGRTPGPLPTPTRTPRPDSTPRTTSPPNGPAEPDSFPELINGGFENLRGDGTPYGWRKQGGEIGTAVDHHTEGARGLVLTSDTTATKWAYQTVSVQPGAYYEASVQALAGPGSESAFLRLSWYGSTDGSGQAIASIDSLESVQPTAQAFGMLITGPVQAPAEANSVKLRLMLRPTSTEQAASYFDDGRFELTQPARGETVRVSGRAPAFGGEEGSLAEVGSPNGLEPGAAVAAGLANVKPSRPGADAPAASARQGRTDWAVLLAIGIPLAAIALIVGHGLRQRRLARKAGADDT